MQASQIRFGTNHSWTIQTQRQIASVREIGTTIDDIPMAVDAALSRPIEFPSLDQMVVAGDNVVFAVDPTIPQLPEVVRACISWFHARGTELANMRIVLASGNIQSVAEVASALESEFSPAPPVEMHDADSTGSVAYIAANEAGEPIYLNRTLVDADVVVPIVCARSQCGLDYFGAFGIYPLLSDRATRGAFYNLPVLDDSTEHARLRSWADQAAWWVGVVAAVEVIPAANNELSGVLAGALAPLEMASQHAISSELSCPDENSDLVIATLNGSAGQQTWMAAARALHNAARCTSAGGAIVLCTEVGEAIGSGLSLLRKSHLDSASISKKLASDSSDDALAASLIFKTLSVFHVYLVSNMRMETVESLGMSVISQPDQLARLIEQFETCTLLSSAQHRAPEFCHS